MVTSLVSGRAAAGYWFACCVIFEVLFFHCVQTHTDQASFREKRKTLENLQSCLLGLIIFLFRTTTSWPCPAEQTPTSPGLELWYFFVVLYEIFCPHIWLLMSLTLAGLRCPKTSCQTTTASNTCEVLSSSNRQRFLSWRKLWQSINTSWGNK